MLVSVPDTPPVATIFPMRETAGMGLAWPNPSTSNDFRLLIVAQPPSREFSRRPIRSAEEIVFEIRIVGDERAIMMSKIGPMQPRSVLNLIPARRIPPGPIDMPPKGGENLRDASQGRTK